MNLRKISSGKENMKDKLLLLISERYDIRPSDAKKVIAYLDNHITEIIATKRMISDTQKEN